VIVAARSLEQLSEQERSELTCLGQTMVALLKRLPAINAKREGIERRLSEVHNLLLELRSEWLAVHESLASNAPYPLEPETDPVPIVEQMVRLLEEVRYTDGSIKTADFAPTRGQPKHALIRHIVELTRKYRLSMAATRGYLLGLGFDAADIKPRAILNHVTALRKAGKEVALFPRGRPPKANKQKSPTS
jgi:hypothetical protein